MLVLLGKLSTMLDLSERIAGRGETAGKLRERQRAKYIIDGMQRCRDTFKFVHAYVYLHSAFDSFTLHKIMIHKILMVILNICRACYVIGLCTRYFSSCLSLLSNDASC